jgi:hypothetical protein
MSLESDSPFLTVPEAAELLRVNRRTLDNKRGSKHDKEDGPPFRRHGGRIVYHRDQLLEWSERRGTRTPPQQQTQETPNPRSGDAEPPRHDVPKSEPADDPVEHKP